MLARLFLLLALVAIGHTADRKVVVLDATNRPNGLVAGDNALLGEGSNLTVGTATGTKLGTSALQKLAAYGATPIVQPTGNVLTALGNLGWVATPTLDASDISTGTLATARGGTGISNATGSLTFNGATTISGGGTVTLGGFTLTVPATGTAALLATANAFTAAQTITAANGLTTLPAATQDAVRIAGRAGGTGSFVQTITTAALTASRTLTLPDANTTITGGGTLALGGFTLTVPATGTVGLLGTIQTWTQANTFSGGAVISSGNLSLASGQTIFASSGDLFVRAGSSGALRLGAGGSNDYLTISSAGVVNATNTTSASSATTGALTVGNGTAATNTGIGGGNINTGGTLTAGGIATFNSTTSNAVDGAGSVVSAGGAFFDRQSRFIGRGASGNTRAADFQMFGNWGADPGTSRYAMTCNFSMSSATFGNSGVTTGADYSITNQTAGITLADARACVATVSSSNATAINTDAYCFYAANGTATGTGTNKHGFYCQALTGATNVYAFRSAGAGLVSIGDTTDSTSPTTGGVTTTSGIGFGVTKSIFGGGFKSTSATLGIGYATGAGGAVTQGTSRTTGVTLNTVCGAITLFSAAGSATYQSFTVTDSAVAATDTVRVCQKSGTDLYEIHVTAVGAGSFVVTYRTTGGTTTEQPVFNFSVIKGVSS